MAIIPEKHKKYNLLERWKRCEIFVEDWALKDDLCERLGEDHIERSFESIDEAVIYYESLKKQIQAPYKNLAADLLTEYVQDLEKKNHREVWSVLRYKGSGYGKHNTFETGRYYYMPCIAGEDVFLGALDDEADLVNWIPITYENWEIIDDPTGMAARVMAGEIEGTTEQDYQENWEAMDEMVEVLRVLEKSYSLER